MKSQTLQCFICFQDYNLSTCIPRVLPRCGHTVCHECVVGLLASSKQCPFDKTNFTGLNHVNSFPVNLSVKELLQQSSACDVCLIHGEKINFVCMKDKLKLCIYCAFYDGHQDHTVKPLAEIDKEIQSKKDQLHAVVKEMDTYEKTLSETINHTKNTMTDRIKSHFDSLRSALINKEEHLLKEVSDFVDNERTLISSLFGKKSALRVSIKSKIINYDNLKEGPEVFAILDEDMSYLTSKLDHSAINDYIQGTKSKLEEANLCLDQSLAAQSKFFSEFESLVQSFSENFKAFQFTEDFIGLSEKLNMASNSLVVATPFTFAKSNKSLEITAQKHSIHSDLNIGEWTNIQDLKFTLESLKFVDQDLSTFSCLLSRLDQVDTLKFHVIAQEDSSSHRLGEWIVSICKKFSKITYLDLNFANTEIGDEVFIQLNEKFLSKAPTLTSLRLNLARSQFTNTSMTSLTKSMSPVFVKLRTFSLSLSRTNITEYYVEKLFVSMPNMVSFELNLDCINLNDDYLKKLAQVTLKSMQNLEVLVLRLYETKITDNGAKILFTEMPNVEKLRLDLRATKVTSPSIDLFLKSKLPQMNYLKAFDLKVLETQVQEGTFKEIEKIKRELSN